MDTTALPGAAQPVVARLLPPSTARLVCKAWRGFVGSPRAMRLRGDQGFLVVTGRSRNFAADVRELTYAVEDTRDWLRDWNAMVVLLQNVRRLMPRLGTLEVRLGLRVPGAPTRMYTVAPVLRVVLTRPQALSWWAAVPADNAAVEELTVDTTFVEEPANNTVNLQGWTRLRRLRMVSMPYRRVMLPDDLTALDIQLHASAPLLQPHSSVFKTCLDLEELRLRVHQNVPPLEAVAKAMLNALGSRPRLRVLSLKLDHTEVTLAPPWLRQAFPGLRRTDAQLMCDHEADWNALAASELERVACLLLTWDPPAQAQPLEHMRRLRIPTPLMVWKYKDLMAPSNKDENKDEDPLLTGWLKREANDKEWKQPPLTRVLRLVESCPHLEVLVLELQARDWMDVMGCVLRSPGTVAASARPLRLRLDVQAAHESEACNLVHWVLRFFPGTSALFVEVECEDYLDAEEYVEDYAPAWRPDLPADPDDDGDSRRLAPAPLAPLAALQELWCDCAPLPLRWLLGGTGPEVERLFLSGARRVRTQDAVDVGGDRDDDDALAQVVQDIRDALTQPGGRRARFLRWVGEEALELPRTAGLPTVMDRVDEPDEAWDAGRWV
jgi:hypothetical protein